MAPDGRSLPAAVSAAEPAPPPAAQPAPANQALPEQVPWQEASQGLVHYSSGACSFRVWAPHASAVVLQIVPAHSFIPATNLPQSSPVDPAEASQAVAEEPQGAAATVPPDSVAQPGMQEIPLERHFDDWGVDLVSCTGASPQPVITLPFCLPLSNASPARSKRGGHYQPLILRSALPTNTVPLLRPAPATCRRLEWWGRGRPTDWW